MAADPPAPSRADPAPTATDPAPGATPVAPTRMSARVARVLMTEESIYGLILVSGMIVVSNSLVGTSINALATVLTTVAVFFLEHVYSGTLARIAADDGHGDLRVSAIAAARHSSGMLAVSLLPLAVLLLGVSGLVDDETSIWGALTLDVLMLGVLGWLSVARWNPNPWARMASALVTATFGVIVMALKVLIHH